MTLDGAAVQIHHLTVYYGSVCALSDVSLDVEAGLFTLISGPSGCGKSTLALCLGGLIPHILSARMAGQVRVNGLDTSAHPPGDLASHVGLVFQNPATQLFNATVDEEVAFAPRNLGLPAEEIVARVAFALEATGIAHLRSRDVRTLSTGEQQRVAIASVLALRPRVLVLDEPTANLDWRGTDQVLSTLVRLQREEGLTVIVIEHRLQALTRLADRVLLMHEGRIVADGQPTEVFADKARLDALGLCYPWHGAEHDDWRRMSEESASPPTGTRPLVALQRLEAGYGRHRVLHGLDLALYPGELVALVGENGAGKSTVARILAGILRPQGGQVIWEPALRRLPLGRRVGLLFQNPLHQLVCDQVEEEVSFGPRNYGQATDDSIEAVLEAADLTTIRHRRPQTLSAGQQQRTALAATLVLSPRLLILDEPTMGQDWGHLSRLMDFLTRLNRNGQAILLITHDYKLVCRYATRVVWLHEGRISVKRDA
ncbi:MAG: ATP-binding cassette domain-containing protein [Anaerolineae bacterium]|jgi:energy-coupling factor transport system ATP-binding protein|nr:ATP-binding cassette domain-containing protein [Anaerolineae bacterium]MDH7473815.1 ATP-binding cassette domain-containing protein [Anaerolineae bacterium]